MHPILRKRSSRFGGCQEEALRDSLAWAKGNVDRELHTGDLIDWKGQANFDLVKYVVGGNYTFVEQENLST